MVDAKLTDVRKTFNDGQVVAIDDIDLHIEDGELLVLVGPSGCGKSTTMRCIAGLETPNGGTIEFGGHEVTNLPPKDREVSMVFQNYALYPSMTVYENMAFGLKMRGADRETIDEQVRWAAETMEIGDLLDRYPTQLSGGQQQRVALGRAIVRDPAIFLLDEPLSNLDAKLRAVMRTEIQELQQELDVAAVFVTHDQEEAMSMGDRIAVMNAGRIEQVAPPEEIYHDPNSLFVADFIGSPAINFFECSLTGTTIDHDVFSFDLPDSIAEPLAAGLDGDQVVIGIRPEDLGITDPGQGLFDTRVEVIEPMGDRKIVYMDVGDRRMEAVVPSNAAVEEGDDIGVSVNWPNSHFFSPSGPKVLKWVHAEDPSVEAGADTGEFVTDGGDGRIDGDDTGEVDG
ncbi:ABC transporter ATP-binding protein [Halobaculum gomorrense]|uniref:ABC-type D-xylose/L-arabinose transporter n=1 Tax=Halobaculum gomorrense TaxID=43928 RepID=A0A1M5JKQ1_9EURY|nr:ABC transporter ATP-binding protein [Halobaculum gomorrense]SHG41101.1 carbohydrate ABC transporter ATP-binding protein, CUT1 family [Halobaculum gomorrense]